jgi:hypothetical protein
MPSPGRSLPNSPSNGWGRAALGALVLAAVAVTWIATTPDTSLSAGESPEDKGSKAAEPVSNEKDTADHVENFTKPEVQPTAATPPAMTSATLAMGLADETILPIPAVELTAKALTRYLRDRRHSEIRDDYPVHSSPSGHPSENALSPAIASPTK